MIDQATRASIDVNSLPRGRLWSNLLLLGQAGVYGIIAILSRRFEFSSECPQRPILLTLLLLTIGFALHLGSLRLALQSSDLVATARRVLLGAVLYRAILLPSMPIQEIDIYRYLWDGAVVACGGNPYRFSPQQVSNASLQQLTSPELRRLVELRRHSRSCEEALARIHYGELVTVYPPVSQAVFGLASLGIPDHASLYQRMVAMKGVLSLWDLATLGGMLAMLRELGRHPAWAILYGWSPLVLKEFANSGHLDSIAVCLTTGAVLCLLRGIKRARTGFRAPWFILSALLTGLGVGAKLYPAVLVPVFALWTTRRVGWRAGIAHAAVALLIGAVSLGPMLATVPATLPQPQVDLPATAPQGVEQVTARSGLATFLSRWEINDLLFLIVVENLRPDAATTPPTPAPWFVVIPNATRAGVAAWLSQVVGRPLAEATFLSARCFTLVIFAVIVAGLLVGASRRDDHESWLRIVFLAIAWFWALAPTQNPWYWTWALPFLPLAGRRAWSAVSLLVLVYYTRFWWRYHFPESIVLGTGYRGEPFFHFVVAPLEHGAWLSWLAMETLFSPNVPALTDDQSPARLA